MPPRETVDKAREPFQPAPGSRTLEAPQQHHHGGVTMGFVQIVDFHAADLDSIRALEERWDAETKGQRTARRALLGQDRADPSHLVNVVFFDSYESAMENSALPSTQAMAGEMQKLAGGAPTFLDLEVIDDRS